MPDSAEETVELPTDASRPERPAAQRFGGDGRTKARSGFWAELSGALAVGLAVLAAVVLAFQIIAWTQGIPGPGLLTVAGHIVAAGLAILAQRFADRRSGWQGAAAVLAVATVSATALWLFWWA